MVHGENGIMIKISSGMSPSTGNTEYCIGVTYDKKTFKNVSFQPRNKEDVVLALRLLADNLAK